MDLSSRLTASSSNFYERAFHCENKDGRKKETIFKKKVSISFMETMFLFIIVALIITQHGVGAKKAKKLQKWKPTCKIQTSQWEECSKPCDMGVSFRVVTTSKCKLKRENRLCVVRHCNEARFKPPIKGKSRCLKMFRSKGKEHLKYAGAVSEKGYKMRYCGVCEDANKCCTPTKTKTRKVRFRTRDGKKFVKQVSFIRKCRCHRKCPSSRSVFTLPLYGDIEREDDTISVERQMNEIAGTDAKTIKNTRKR